MFRPCWFMFRKKLFVTITLGLHFTVEGACPDRGEFTPPKTTQYTVNSSFSRKCTVQLQCNGNENFSLKIKQQGRNM
jgi:hypothetical protein